MAPLDVCPMEDALEAFLEHLVDPMLRGKSSSRENLTPSHQQQVAKQVHAVVFLYNYYHRKQHPEQAFLPFDQFCKKATVMRTTLLAYMNFMQNFDATELVDVDKQLSLTEKKIMDACDICTSLDASRSIPNIEGWPISKVAILLTDSGKESCFLLYSAITEGVWSVIEKDVDISIPSTEVTTGAKYIYKKKRVIKKPAKDELNIDEAGFLKLRNSALKEAAGGIDTNKIDVLASYTVYSQSKEKTASRFYIMKCSINCSQIINDELTRVPIKDLIQSLQGPLVKKSSSSWMITPVVEYFHVLPYSEIISDWFSRETFSNSLQDSRLLEKKIMVKSPEVTESYVNEGMSIVLDNRLSSDNIESPKQKENNVSCTPALSDSTKEPEGMNVDNSSVFPSQDKEKCNYVSNTSQLCEDQEIKNPSMQHYLNGSTSAVKVEKADSTRMLITEGGINSLSACNKICANTSSDRDSLNGCGLIANYSNSDFEKLPNLLASKGEILSQTALTVLIRKRNELALQQRMIEDKIAQCDKKIQRMLTGGEDELELKIESIIEGCNDTWLRNQGGTSHHLEDLCLPPCIKRKRLTEAVLVMQSPCQELDGVCHENHWILPTYRLSQSDGGYQANVTVKGLEFEHSCVGKLCSHPRDARDSAAGQMLANLRSMAKSVQ